MFGCHHTVALCTLIGVMASAVAVTATYAPLTCIDFDDADSCSITATNDVCLSVFGVYAISGGVEYNRGVFQDPTRITIPYFWGKSYDEFSISLLFSKEVDTNTFIVSTGHCDRSAIVIKSKFNSRMIVKVKTSVGAYELVTFTSSQTASFIHVVVTFKKDTGTGAGRLRIYVDGVKLAEKSTYGEFGPLPGPIILGSTGCPYPSQTGVMVFMDNVCFFDVELQESDIAE